MFKKIDEFDEAYAILEASFPVSEIRPYDKIKKFYNQQLITIYGYYDPKLRGAMIIWQDDTYAMVENFAVDQTIRSKGIGSKMLQALCEQLGDKTIVLEVETPYDKMSEKRIAFYEKNGFILSEFGYDQPKINKVINKIPLQIMAYNKKIDESEFLKIKKMIFDSAYNDHH